MSEITKIVCNLTGKDKFNLQEIVSKFHKPDEILAVRVNQLITNSNTVLRRFGREVTMEPVYKHTLEGEAILRRSFVFLLSMAMDDVFGAKRPWFVRHQSRNGYFCEFEDQKHVNDDMIKKIKARMVELSNEKHDISQRVLYYEDAIQYFRKKNQPLTLRLLQSHNYFDVPVDSCRDFFQMHHRVLAPNTSFLKEFDLEKRLHGFVLLHTFKKIDAFYDSPKEIEDERIVEIIKDQSRFVNMSGVTCIGDINKKACTNEIENFVCLCNTFHEKQMNSMVRRIRDKRGVRIILIAGPSASGKTTFAKKLRRILLCKGIKSYMVSVDNYFRPNVECPIIDERTGQRDFESLKAIRIDLLNDHLVRLLKGENVSTPKFDFHQGKPIENVFEYKIEDDAVLILEGIHCLNNKLTPSVQDDKKFKIFIAPLSVINYDDRNYIGNATMRLIRRIVRDKTHRGHPVEDTLQMWPMVRRAEHKFIFPYMNDSDFIFNSALDYEIGVFKRYVKPLLRTVSPSSVHFQKANQLLVFLEKVIPIPYKYVPQSSLLQEFLKGHWLN